MKKRHVAGISLGAISSTGASPEVDLSSMDSAIVYITAGTGSGNCVISLEAASQDFGATATWQQIGGSTRTVTASTSVAVPVGVQKAVPLSDAHITGSSFCPRRFRVKHVSGSTVSASAVEGIRTIA